MNFLVKKYFRLRKKFWGKKNVGSKSLVSKNFELKRNWGQKIFLSIKLFLGSYKILVKKISCPKKFRV